MSYFVDPFGISPLGLFTPEQLQFIAASPPGVLADAIDFGETDASKPGRMPTFDVVSLTVGIHPIDEQLLTALSLVKSSGAAVQNDGNEFASVRKLGQDAASLLVSIGQNAVKRLVTNGDIRILSMTVETSGDSAELTTNYQNLRASDRSRVRTIATPISRGSS